MATRRRMRRRSRRRRSSSATTTATCSATSCQRGRRRRGTQRRDVAVAGLCRGMGEDGHRRAPAETSMVIDLDLEAAATAATPAEARAEPPATAGAAANGSRSPEHECIARSDVHEANGATETRKRHRRPEPDKALTQRYRPRTVSAVTELSNAARIWSCCNNHSYRSKQPGPR